MMNKKVFLYALLLSIFFISCGSSGSNEGGGLAPVAYDLSGTWDVTETSGSNTCDEPVGVTDLYVATLAQSGNSFTWTETGSSPLPGTISGTSITISNNGTSAGCPDGLSWTVSATAASAGSVSGTSTWTCKYTGGSCGGTDYISATRQGGVSGGTSEIEPNNSFNSAQLMSIPETINGSISSSSDYDFYEFTAIYNFTITLSNFGSSDLDIAIYDNGNVRRGYSATTNSSETINYWDSGIYYIMVIPKKLSGSNQNYTLTIE